MMSTQISDKFDTEHASKEAAQSAFLGAGSVQSATPDLRVQLPWESETSPQTPQRRQGFSLLKLLAWMAVILTLVAQQLQINDLKAELNVSYEIMSELKAKTGILQSQNQQVSNLLRQFESRIGYMDNKVEHIIDDNVEKEQQLRHVQRTREQAASESDRERHGSVLREMFGGLFR